MSALSEPRKALLQEAIFQMIQQAAESSATHTQPALANVTASQTELERELQRLDDEMESVTSVLETVTLDPETSKRMEQTQDCLKRTKRKLTTIRGRLGRLRMYEMSDRLQLAERQLDVVPGRSTGAAATARVEGGVSGSRVHVDDAADPKSPVELASNREAQNATGEEFIENATESSSAQTT